MPTLQPRPKTTRSLRLLDIDGRLVLVITMQQSTRRAEEKFYHLTSLPESAGCAFELRQSELCGGETYHVSLDVEEIVYETDKAFFLRLAGGEQVWVPRSQVAEPEDYQVGDVDCTVSVSEWFATKEGLL